MFITLSLLFCCFYSWLICLFTVSAVVTETRNCRQVSLRVFPYSLGSLRQHRSADLKGNKPSGALLSSCRRIYATVCCFAHYRKKPYFYFFIFSPRCIQVLPSETTRPAFVSSSAAFGTRNHRRRGRSFTFGSCRRVRRNHGRGGLGHEGARLG